MGDIIKQNSKDIVNLLHNSGSNVPVPKPFEKEIFLFDTYVAGTTYIENIEQIEKELNIEDKLDFFREPNNVYDNQAIAIKFNESIKIGYVPKKDNVIFARLMDAGKLLYGRVAKKEKRGTWVKIDIKVYLKE